MILIVFDLDHEMDLRQEGVPIRSCGESQSMTTRLDPCVETGNTTIFVGLRHRDLSPIVAPHGIECHGDIGRRATSGEVEDVGREGSHDVAGWQSNIRIRVSEIFRCSIEPFSISFSREFLDRVRANASISSALLPVA